jgi:hypothetical protein
MAVKGQYGYIPRDPDRPVLTYESYLDPRAAVALPPVPMDADIDRASLVPSWPMYCNGPDPANATCCPGSPNGCGCCVWAAVGHFIQAMTAYADEEVILPPQAIITGYASTGYDPQTGANDNGTDPQSALEYMRSVGMTDAAGKVHKVAGYALVGNPANELVLGQILNTFGAYYCAYNIAQAQEDQFSADEPFAWSPGSPIAGGHMMTIQRRAVGWDIYKPVTWGTLWSANRAFQRRQAVEAYAVVTEDWIRLNGTTVEGMDLEQLLSDMSEVS